MNWIRFPQRARMKIQNNLCLRPAAVAALTDVCPTSVLKYLRMVLYNNIRITFVQRRPYIFDVGPTLCKCYTNVLYSPGIAELCSSGYGTVQYMELFKPSKKE